MSSIPYTVKDLESHNAVSFGIENNEGKFLTFWHHKFSFRTIPLGKAEAGQTPEDAVKQEAWEELGIRVKTMQFLGEDSQTEIREGNTVHIHLYTFLVTAYEGEIKNMEPEKHKDIEWHTRKELQSLHPTSDGTMLFLKYV
jgi:8-oxo-dGTP pyrophosphatase MutT (NUDIX family)